MTSYVCHSEIESVISDCLVLSRSRVELKKVTDIFTRMFHDPHGKVRYNRMVVVIAGLAET